MCHVALKKTETAGEQCVVLSRTLDEGSRGDSGHVEVVQNLLPRFRQSFFTCGPLKILVDVFHLKLSWLRQSPNQKGSLRERKSTT